MIMKRNGRTSHRLDTLVAEGATCRDRIGNALLWGAAVLLLSAHAGCFRSQSRQNSTPNPSPQDQPVVEFDEATIRRHNRAVAFMGQFDYAAAYQELAELVQKHPDSADMKVDLAIATLNRRQTGDTERAMALLEEVQAVAPQNLRADYCLAILKLDAADPEGALTLFAKVAAADPTDAYAAYYTGQCEFQMGRLDAALKQYQVAIARDPYLRSGYYGAFQTSQRLGNQTKADEYRQAFERLSNNPQARLAEIKYTRMGPKAELVAVEAPSFGAIALPTGPLFRDPKPLADRDGRVIPWTVSRAHEVNITLAELWADGPSLLVMLNASRDVDAPNVVMEVVDNQFHWLPGHPLATVSDASAAAWGDYDNDGYTDVYISRDGPNQLFRQVGPQQWLDVSAVSGTQGEAVATLDAQFFDADHDGDLDLFVANNGPNELFSNNLDGTFRPLGEAQGLHGSGASSYGAAILDVDGDRDLDLLVFNTVGGADLYVNDRLWSYQQPSLPATFTGTRIAAAVPVDLDVDGRTDLLTLSPQGLQIWTFTREGQWLAREFAGELGIPSQSGEEALGNISSAIAEAAGDAEVAVDGALNAPPSTVASRLSVADLNGDGRLDVTVASHDGWEVFDCLDGRKLAEHGELLPAYALLNLETERGPSLLAFTESGPLLWNPGPGRFPFLQLRFTGKEDQADQMRSNRSGIGVQAAARVGTQWTALRTLRADSGPGQSLQSQSLGLRASTRLDLLQLTWPDGVYQTEYDLLPGQLHRISETQRQVASCPVVFAWNGSEHAFVTDVLGVGGIGFNVGFGEYATPRPWERLLMPQHSNVARNGRMEIKRGEPMEEVCYLDAARLVAYDLPKGWRMTLDERFAVLGPAPTGQPVFYQHLWLPTEAVNDRGQSVLEALTEVDFQAAEPGARDPRFLGLTKPHWVEVTFAQPLDTASTCLLMDGWVEYPYSQTMFAAWQAGVKFAAPTLEALDATGKWILVQQEFGYMAGMPRQAMLPLPVEALPKGTRKLRLSTNQEIYWDRLAVIVSETPSPVQKHHLPLLEASLSEVGFARRTTFPQRRPYYNYQHRAPLWDTRHPRGLYSEWGDVHAMVQQTDDAVAVFGPGEEIHFDFSAPPAQADGTERFFVLELDGWCKDMDLYTQDGDTVAPLPTRGHNADPQWNQKRRRLHEENHARLGGGP